MAPPKRHDDELEVDDDLVRRLLRAQFPQWADLPLRVLEPSGTDHTVYRLGDELVVRMPVRPGENQQAAREAQWLPFLAPQVPLELPVPVGLGRDNIDHHQAAVDLARFVRALHACDATGGPPAGAATWWRGMPLHIWEGRLEEWVAKLDGFYDVRDALTVWGEAVAAPPWDRPPVWFHGDLTGNLIARDRRLVGAIDSPYGVGDPACDLMPGWTLFRGEARRIFFDEVGLDEATITRARGWAIAPALIGLSYYRDVPHLFENARLAIEGALS
jgi:aminoglycoside phosphotransferase (APT) family kinase protein